MSLKPSFVINEATISKIMLITTNINPNLSPSFVSLFALLKYQRPARLVKITVIINVVRAYIEEIDLLSANTLKIIYIAASITIISAM